MRFVGSGRTQCQGSGREAALIAVAIIGVARIVGTTISATFQNISTEMAK